MKVGVVVDGRAEYASLPFLYARLQGAIPCTLLNPVLADLQPLAPYGAIARACLKPALVLKRRGADTIVVLLDREVRNECCGDMAEAIAGRLSEPLDVQVCVVIKNRQYENWLIAALSSLRAQPGRFRISAATESSVAPNMADHVQALRLLKQSTLGAFDKVQDSKRILQRADPLEMGCNSRSFRRMLRCLGHPLYEDQSRNPARVS